MPLLELTLQVMAFFRKPDIGEAFKSDKQLKQFLLSDVTPTGRILGTGSYGSVEEVSYKHLVCAGKKLHESLVDVETKGVAKVVLKYLQECQLMSSLRHPNITQFLGLCFLPGTQLPLLVMERLETNLDDLLKCMQNLPLSLKRSVLEDIAHGLLYLHSRSPPIIHSDLTATNVLLTSSLVAKITDMGNSRIVTWNPGQLAKTMTKCPGTLVYMPPEAQDGAHCYGPPVDVFSFGHLALYALTEIFPGDLLPSTYPTPDNPHKVKGRTEVERRERYIQALSSQLHTNHSGLVELVKQCLLNNASERPNTEELLMRLQRMRGAVEYGEGLLTLDLAKLKIIKDMKEKEKRMTEQQESRRRLEKQQIENRIKNLQQSFDRLKRVQVTTLEALLYSWETNRQNVNLIKNLTSAEHSTLFEMWEGTWKRATMTTALTTTVTIKVWNKSGILSDAEFLQDAVVMSRLQHPNIVQLLAVCWKDNQSPYIISEPIKFGSLDAFLRKEKDEGRCLKESQLINMCEQIASGMAYMESQNYIHSTLAAKRISLTANLTCKVGNFFLSHSTACKGQNVSRYSTRWAPPEATAGVFTSKSDVWSFGIVLYEVITHGQTPYHGIVTSEVLPKVKQGYRMSKPDSCSQKLYEVMLDCWNKEPSSRLTFQLLQSRLQVLTGTDQNSTTKPPKTQTKVKEAVTKGAGKGIKDAQLQKNEKLQAKSDKISSTKVQKLEENVNRNQTTPQNTVNYLDTDKQANLVKKLNPDSFTNTWEGTWNATGVIIKVQQPGSSPATFLQDADVMSNLRHPNILQLLAVYKKKQPFLIICELVEPENLLDYLRNHQSLKQPRLLALCQQIANGMSYMESQHYIHGNLQAKNVFLTDNLTCKVANFCLADTIADKKFLNAPASTKHAVMWLPPEVLEACKFTRKSDVWSFGIVLHEIFTYGCLPYIGISDVTLKVKQGYRMPQPLACPDKLYGMMLNCWQEKPESRPTFQTLLTQLEKFTKDECNK